MFFLHRFSARGSSGDKRAQEEVRQEDSLQQHDDVFEHLFSISASDKRLMLHGLETFRALQHSEQDCFRDAAFTLQSGCRSLSVSKHDKVEYALLLTLCELSTANLKVPTVCDPPFNESSRAQQCVMQLARVPQTWTSYSGYFRDAESMCLAIRYPVERELLEQLHRNFTKQQMENLVLLHKYQQQMTTWHREGMANIEHINRAQERLWQQWQLGMREMHEKAKHDLSNIADLILSMQDDLQSKQQEQLQYLETLDASLKHHFRALWDSTEHELQQILSQVEARVGYVQAGLESALTLQQEASAEWRQIQDAQMTAAKQWQDVMSDMNTTLLFMLSATSQSISYLHNDIQSAHKQLQGMLEPFSRVGIALILLIGIKVFLALPYRWAIALVLLHLLLPDRRAHAMILLFLLIMYIKGKRRVRHTQPTSSVRLRRYHDMIQ